MNTEQEIRNYIIDRMLFDNNMRLDEDVSFQKSGIFDSVGFLELITFIEEKFDIKISDRELNPENFDTLRKVSCFVENKMKSNFLDRSSEAVK
jgi:acyl carrier protein